LDIDAETIYEDGITVRIEKNIANESVASAISAARAKAGLSQKQVAAIAGMDQSDFSKIERGMTNPSILTLERIARAMGGKLTVNIEL
jgi:transcriptional regulator with XRE-family HTH domain